MSKPQFTPGAVCTKPEVHDYAATACKNCGMPLSWHKTDIYRVVPHEINDHLYQLTKTRWLGYQMMKSPMDLYVYANLIYDLRPDFLIETGTWFGASALYFATIMDAIDHGVVVTIDNWNWINRPRHSRIFYCEGSSIDEGVVKVVSSHAANSLRVMVVLDSLHTKEHVLKELEIYAPMVKPLGSYIVVEDTNIHGHPVREDLPEGPWEAVHEWLPGSDFEIDNSLELLGTVAPDGWLRRVK